MRLHQYLISATVAILAAAFQSNAFVKPFCFRSPCNELLQTRLNSDTQSLNDETRDVFRLSQTTVSRRQLLIASILTGTSLSAPPSSSAADTKTDGIVSTTKLASLLSTIPTFAIVDPKGVPYFVVGEDAKLTSYFFTSYGETRRVLDVAQKSADKAIKATRDEIKKKNGGVVTKADEEEIGTNPWKEARITSVPLDLAVSLCSKGKLAGAYFRLAPSLGDIEDALAIDGSGEDDLPEGKVPLFYVEEDFTITRGGDEKVSPLYFQKDQLIAEWKRQKLSSGEPEVKVTELFATLTEMLRPGGTDEELKSLVFVAPSDSGVKAKQVLAGEKEPFRLGERNVVL